jgi:hypothetical protein
VFVPKINHKWHKRIFEVDVHPHLDCERVVSVPQKTKPIVHQQKLIATVSIAVVGLLTWLKCPTLKVTKDYIHFIVMKFGFIPAELFVRFVRSRALIFICSSFGFEGLFGDFRIYILVSV